MKLRPIGKKADLSLSINAIVILILAITVMGLGLTFIRGLFKGATEKLGGALQATDLRNPPSLENPLTIDKRITISAGDKKPIEIGVYNTNTQDELADAKPSIDKCVNSAGDEYAQGDLFAIAAPAQTIAPRGTAGYSSILSITAENLESDTYICTVIVAGSDPLISASTFIEVK